MSLPRAAQLRERMRVAFGHDRILCSPYCEQRHDRRLPSLVEALTQYRLGPDGKPKKDTYSHVMDGLQYAVSAVWPIATVSMREQDRPS